MTHDPLADRARLPELRIEPFDVHGASASTWAAYQRYRRVRDLDRAPDMPLMSDAEFVRTLQREEPLVQHHRWTAWAADGEPVGNLLASVRRPGTPGAHEHAELADAWCYVLPAWRRRGIAGRMLGTLHHFLQMQGRTLVTVQAHHPAAWAWLASLGTPPRLATVQNRLHFDRLDPTLLQRWREAPAIAAHGLRWELHAGRVPLDRLAQLLPVFDRLFRDVPLGALEGPPVRHALEDFRSWYADMDARGGAHHLALLLDAAGEMAALSIGSWDARMPDVLWQKLTTTDPRWRGLGLAKAVKAALLVGARELHPTLRRAVTVNAEVNAPMLAVNRQMGYEVHRREAFYQAPREAIGAWLAKRG